MRSSSSSRESQAFCACTRALVLCIGCRSVSLRHSRPHAIYQCPLGWDGEFAAYRVVCHSRTRVCSLAELVNKIVPWEMRGTHGKCVFEGELTVKARMLERAGSLFSALTRCTSRRLGTFEKARRALQFSARTKLGCCQTSRLELRRPPVSMQA